MKCPMCNRPTRPAALELKVGKESLGKFPGTKCSKGHGFIHPLGSHAAEIEARARGLWGNKELERSYFYHGDVRVLMKKNPPECPECKGAWAPTLTAVQISDRGVRLLFVCHDDGRSWWWSPPLSILNDDCMTINVTSTTGDIGTNFYPISFIKTPTSTSHTNETRVAVPRKHPPKPRRKA